MWRHAKGRVPANQPTPDLGDSLGRVCEELPGMSGTERLRLAGVLPGNFWPPTYVLSPEGKLLSFLPVPTDEVTNCAFGGDDRKTLYVTGGGTLYSVRTTTPGRVLWPTK